MGWAAARGKWAGAVGRFQVGAQTGEVGEPRGVRERREESIFVVIVVVLVVVFLELV